MKVSNLGSISILTYGTEKKTEFLDAIEEFNGLTVKSLTINKAKSPKFGDNVVVEVDKGIPMRIMGADISNGKMVVNGTPLNNYGKEGEGVPVKAIEALNERAFTATLKSGKLYLQEAKEAAAPAEKKEEEEVTTP